MTLGEFRELVKQVPDHFTLLTCGVVVNLVSKSDTDPDYINLEHDRNCFDDPETVVFQTPLPF